MWVFNKKLLFIGISFVVVSSASYAQEIPQNLSAKRKSILEKKIQEENEMFLKLQEENRRFRPPAIKPSPKGFVADLNTRSKKNSKHSKKKSCVSIKKINITGDDELGESQKKKFRRGFEGSCLDLLELNILLKTISKYYLKQGYINTRPYLVPQSSKDKKNNVLKVVIIKARIESISFAENNKEQGANQKPKNKKTYHSEIMMAFPLLIGSHLSLFDIEQGLDQFNRLASNNIKAHFYPSKKQGGTKIVLNNESKKRWQGSIRFDNSGSEEAGKETANYKISYDNLLALNDYFSLNRQQNLHNTKNNFNYSNSLLFSLPWGYWNLSVFLSLFQYSNIIKGTLLDFSNKGQSKTQSISLEHVIHRNQQGKTSLGYENKFRESLNFIEETLLITSSRSIRTQKLSLSHNRSLYGGYWNSGISSSRGKLNKIAASESISELTADLDFSKTQLYFGYQLPFSLELANKKHALQWKSSFQGQSTADILFSGEQLSIGGEQSVRGFKDISINGDNGFTFRNEIHWLVPKSDLLFKKDTLSKIQHSIFVAYDLGKVFSNSETESETGGQKNQGELRGLALGFESQAKYFSFSFIYSKPLRGLEEKRKEGDKTILSLALELKY